MYFLIFGFGVSLTFHRSMTHRALDMHPILLILGKFFASVGGTGSPISWILIHRSHHRHADTDKDPHSARDIFKYAIGKYPEVDQRGLRKLAQSKFNKFIHRYYYLIISIYGAFWYTLGTEFFYYGFVYPMVLNILAGHLVNWYTHSNFLLNYRLHNTNDHSQNNLLIGLFTWGEGLHNNHHRFPGSANFSNKAWEIDFTYIFAKLLKLLGLIQLR